MSGTRSPFPPAPATEGPAALIVAHGSPSAPDAQERAIAELARRVGAELEGWQVRGATLAAPGALEAAVASLGGRDILVHPQFMADGWFVSEELPRRLAAAHANAPTVLPAFGLDPALVPLASGRLCQWGAEAGVDLEQTALLVAAHGSPSDPRAGRAARAFAGAVAASVTFRTVAVGFIDEPPYLADVARLEGPAVCLPYFATRAGHVIKDVPEALETAGVAGATLEPIGLAPGAAGLIARALRRAVPARAS